MGIYHYEFYIQHDAQAVSVSITLTHTPPLQLKLQVPKISCDFMQLCSLGQTKVERAVQPLHSGAALKLNLLWLYTAIYFGFLNFDLCIPRQDLMTLALPYHYGLSSDQI